MRRDTRGSREVGVIARDHAPTPRAMRLPIRPWHQCRGWPAVSSGRPEGREMHGGLLWAAFEEWAAHHHSARRSIGLHRHAASEPHRLLFGPVPAAGRPARQRAWPTWPRLKHPEKRAPQGHRTARRHPACTTGSPVFSVCVPCAARDASRPCRPPGGRLTETGPTQGHAAGRAGVGAGVSGQSRLRHC